MCFDVVVRSYLSLLFFVLSSRSIGLAAVGNRGSSGGFIIVFHCAMVLLLVNHTVKRWMKKGKLVF